MSKNAQSEIERRLSTMDEADEEESAKVCINDTKFWTHDPNPYVSRTHCTVLFWHQGAVAYNLIEREILIIFLELIMSFISLRDAILHLLSSFHLYPFWNFENFYGLFLFLPRPLLAPSSHFPVYILPHFPLLVHFSQRPPITPSSIAPFFPCVVLPCPFILFPYPLLTPFSSCPSRYTYCQIKSHRHMSPSRSIRL